MDERLARPSHIPLARRIDADLEFEGGRNAVHCFEAIVLGRLTMRVQIDESGCDHKSGRVRKEKVPTAYDGHGGGERPLFRSFLTAIDAGRRPSPSAAESMESHRIAYAAMESARTGRIIDLG